MEFFLQGGLKEGQGECRLGFCYFFFILTTPVSARFHFVFAPAFILPVDFVVVVVVVVNDVDVVVAQRQQKERKKTTRTICETKMAERWKKIAKLLKFLHSRHLCMNLLRRRKQKRPIMEAIK